MENTGRKTVKGRTTSAPLVARNTKSGAKRSAAETATAKTPATSTPTREEVARRSYEIFLARGGEHGRHLEDWVQAERELGLI